ncbi:MAG: DUF1622 domain-containing protein [Chakrabartia sp.]
MSDGLGSFNLSAMADPVARIIEMTGIAVILASVVFAAAKFGAEIWQGVGDQAYARCRAHLGRGILLGLELLVGADIIATVTAPLTWESLGLLAGIVLIRTFLSFSLEVEIEGRWPWQAATLPGRADQPQP